MNEPTTAQKTVAIKDYIEQSKELAAVALKLADMVKAQDLARFGDLPQSQLECIECWKKIVDQATKVKRLC